MATLTDQELEKILDILFIHLQKKGLFPVGVDKKQVITNVLNSLKTAISGNISAETLRERSFQRLLGLALVNSALLRSPQLTAKFIDILLHKYKKMSVAEMKTKLRVFLRAINGLQPANKQLNDDQLNKLVELIAANLLKFSQKENEKTPTPTYNDPLTETLRNLFGGVDPRFANGQVSTLGVLVGNLMGLVDPGPGKTPGATIDEADDLTGPDPTGTKEAAKQRMISIDGVSSDDLTDQINLALFGQVNPSSPSPFGNWPPKPTPPK